MLSNVLKYLRIDDWMDSKVPFMLSIALFSYLYNDTNMTYFETYAFIGAYFFYVSMFLAFSYVVNDFTDIEVDRKAGKHKVMFMLPKWIIVLSIVVIVLIGVCPMYILVNEKGLFLKYTLFLYIMGAAYSVRWLLRFKERGFIGLIECSIAQRCLPLVPLVFLFSVDWMYFLIFAILSFVNGLRYILIHQAVDYENDINTGVKTFVSEGYNKYKTCIKIACIIECALFFCVFTKLGVDHFYIFFVLLIYCIFEKIIGTVVVKYMNNDLFCTFLAVPLEALYNVFFPIMMAVILTVDSVECFGILVFLVFLTLRCFKGKAAFILVYGKSKKKTPNCKIGRGNDYV